MAEIKKGRLCFEEKNRMFSPPNKLYKSHKLIYLSNKFNDRIMFENEEEFYHYKIKKLENFAKRKYGKEFKGTFISLFGDFLPPKKITKDLPLNKTTRAHSAVQTSRRSARPSREMSCSLYRLKKKVTEGSETSKLIKTMTTFV